MNVWQYWAMHLQLMPVDVSLLGTAQEQDAQPDMFADFYLSKYILILCCCRNWIIWKPKLREVPGKCLWWAVKCVYHSVCGCPASLPQVPIL